MISRINILTLLLLLTSCGMDSEFAIKSPAKVTPVEPIDPPITGPEVQKEVFNQKNQPHIGIIWVMDNSFSMEEEQKNLANNFNSFIKGFINSRAKFTMGITTTDSKHVAKSITSLTSENVLLDQNLFIENFQKLIKVGTNGASKERGYQGSHDFINKYAEQIITKDSYLSVIYVSDEPDRSDKGSSFYLDHMRSLVSHPSKVQTHAILDLDNSGGDDSTRGEKYLDSVVKTGGVAADIDGNFAQALTNIGNSIIDLLDFFELSKVPLESCLEVFVNGVLVTEWSYDKVRNAIVFDVPPSYKAEVVVKYLLP